MDATLIVIGSPANASRARSALPHAPVIERQVESRPAQPKRAAASVLRRFAAKLDPSYT